jgi:hypothetical protein
MMLGPEPFHHAVALGSGFSDQVTRGVERTGDNELFHDDLSLPLDQ